MIANKNCDMSFKINWDLNRYFNTILIIILLLLGSHFISGKLLVHGTKLGIIHMNTAYKGISNNSLVGLMTKSKTIDSM